MKIDAKRKFKLKGIIKSFDPGHGITSRKVEYHNLKPKVKMDCSENEYKSLFVCKRIKAAVQEITGVDYTGSFSHISILLDNDTHKEEIEKNLNIPTQSIEDYEKGDNYGIVMDVMKNVMSYETMCVIYVKSAHGNEYNIVTRARVILVIIDIVTDDPPLDEFDTVMDLTQWIDDGNDFAKYS